MTPRIAVAGIYHESNSFARARTGREAFAPWIRGDAIRRMRGTQTAIGGFLDGCEAHGLEAAPALYVWATPSGVVERPVFDEISRDITCSLRAVGAVDALLLELHGAMVADGIHQADVQLAAAARRAVGPEALIVAVLDPHANVPREIADEVDVLLAYQSNPHVDMNQRGQTAVGVLLRSVSAPTRPTTSVIPVPVVAPPVAQATSDDPLAKLVQLARATERDDPEMLGSSIFFGYAYADVPELGMSVAVSHLDGVQAHQVAGDLAEHCWDARDDFTRALVDADAALDAAAGANRLVVIADTGDNVGGGSSGASTVLLGKLLDRPDLAGATTLCDPVAVVAAQSSGQGGTFDARVGYPPVRLTGVVRYVGPGRYRNQGPLSAGVEFDMGDVAVVESGRSRVLLCSRAVMANDQNMLRVFGIVPEAHDVVILKGAAAIRAGFENLSPRFIDAGTPGETTCDLATLPYRHRPSLHPLDPDVRLGGRER